MLYGESYVLLYEIMKAGNSLSNPYRIQVLEKTIRILNVILEAGHPLSLQDLSERTQTPKSTTFRIVTNLINAGYLTEQEDGYWLGLALLRLGHAVNSHLDISRIAEPFLIELRDQTRETTYLAMLTHDIQVQYLHYVPSNQPVSVSLSKPGTITRAHCTALGKAMLAFLPENELDSWLANTEELYSATVNSFSDKNALRQELCAIRERGYATDNEEYMLTICCVAAPIFDVRQRVIAALSVAGPNTRMPQPLIGSQISEQVMYVARQISTQMGLTR